MTPIPRGLLIAGGLGLTAGAGFLLFKGNGDKKVEGGDPAGAGAGGLTPTAGTPGAIGPGSPGPSPSGTSMPGLPGPGAGAGLGAGTAAGSGKLVGGQQVGPYTVIPDPQSGQMIVFETATEQPVGMLDAQGNFVPLEGSGGALGPGAGPGGIGAGTGGIGAGTGGLAAGESEAQHAAESGAPTGTSSSAAQAAAGQKQFAAVARELFANAGNGGVGSASSDAMAGQSSLTPATGFDPGAAIGGVTREQVGNFTLIDDGSGTKVVLDTASQTPVAMMDAAGTVTPISVDAQGNVSVTGAPIGSAASGAASLSGGTGSTVPTGLPDASTGASPYGFAATATTPAAITSPVGAMMPGLR